MTGIILAGGKNTRIGLHKAFLKIDNKPIIEIMVTMLYHICREVIIVTNNADDFMYLNAKIVSDIIPNKNSLGGLYTGLVRSTHEYSFVAACDMPFITTQVIDYLRMTRNGFDAVIPEYNNMLQPLCAVYSKNCLPAVEKMLTENNLKIIDLLRYVKVRSISEKEMIEHDIDGSSFLNINTFHEYKQYKNGLPVRKHYAGHYI